MHQQLDPKTIIAKANAEAKVKKQIKKHNTLIGPSLWNYRGHVTLMMSDGTIKTGTIKLATHMFVLLDPDTLGKLERIEMSDIADFDLG